jgi:hypothetical protein
VPQHALALHLQEQPLHDKRDCQQECLDERNYCTMSHDMSSGTPPEKM